MESIASTLDDYTSRITREIRRRSRDLTIPPHQARALKVIDEDPIRLAVLADHLRISPRAVTDVVDALSDAGYITVRPDPSDRRAKIAAITTAGSDLASKLRRDRAEIADQIFSPLSPTQQKQLRDLLAIVVGKTDSNLT